jgi:serine/threonine protein kinase
MATQQGDSRVLSSGHILVDYRIESVLGQGAFGITYLATDISLDVRVAIKEYFPREFSVREGSKTVSPAGSKDDREFFAWGRERFLSEARILARLDHPNIVSVRRLLEANQTAYLVMDYCDGRPLDEIIEADGPISDRQLDKILWPMLDALEHVHRAGLVHRDIKPANIYIRADGSPVLLDFGAARNDISAHSKSVTSLATAGYAPLEQYDTHGKQGPWSDIYGFSATLYRALSGERPPDAAGRVLGDTLKPLKVRLDGKFDTSTLSAIDSGLAVLPNARPQSVKDWRGLFGARSISKAEPTTMPAVALRDNSNIGLAKGELSSDPKASKEYLVWGVVALACIGGLLMLFGGGEGDPKSTKEIAKAPVAVSVPDVPPPTIDKKPDLTAPDKPVSKPRDAGSTLQGECPTNIPSSQWTNCKGVRVNSNGSRYEGNFLNGKYDGKGVLSSNGDVYTGDFQNGTYHGFGSYRFSNGDSYVGDWRFGKNNGRGTFTYADGSRYQGEYKDNNRHGKGIEVFKDGSKYEGDYQDNSPNGQGTLTGANGDKYVGSFRNGKYDGLGTYTFKDGESYSGEHKDGNKHGRGVYRFRNGKTQEGIFDNGRFVRSELVPDYIVGRSNSGTSSQRSGPTSQSIMPSLTPTGPNVALLAACKKMAAEVARESRVPTKKDGVEWYSLDCKLSPEGLMFTYRFTVDGAPLEGTELEFSRLRVRETMRKTLCSGKDTRPLLDDYPFEYVYDRRRYGPPEVTFVIRKGDCT